MRRVSFRRAFVAALVVACVGSGSRASAQDVDDHSSFLVDLTKNVAIDPTTYAPAIALYGSMRLDWISSQPLFAHGWVEDNSRYTINGLPHDRPVSFSEGNRRILFDSLNVLPLSLANNAAARVVEHALIDRFPSHPKMVRTIGWIERVTFASVLSYRLSAQHFAQWRLNQELQARHNF